jgi:folate-dependent tRNA-U54 methylase TrmFO/GidA
MLGALLHYLGATDEAHFQPINAMWGLVEPLGGPEAGATGAKGKPKTGKYQRYLAYRERARTEFEDWARGLGFPLGDVSVWDAQAALAAEEAETRKATSR